jgi:hypothetical protein
LIDRNRENYMCAGPSQPAIPTITPSYTLPRTTRSEKTTTMDRKYTKHQQRIIKNYYDNRDAISLQRLSELVTELYLAEGKGRERQWKYIVTALEKLGLPDERIEHLRKKDDPRLLAQLVEELMARQK